MKTRISLFMMLYLFAAYQGLKAQLVGSNENGRAPAAEVKASEIDAGAYSGDVNLFTGTYNSSYNLGIVTTPSGMSFSANLSYASTYAAGNNLPHTSGIPYGEGWSLEMPTISVSTEDYNKYDLEELRQIRDKNFTSQPPFTPIFYNSENENCDAAVEEGRLYWYAPMVSVPGVFSGRLVLKKVEGQAYVFIPHRFEKYLEARLRPDNTWLIVTDDGTQYEMTRRVFSQRNSSNQRVQIQDECLTPQALGNLVVPKTETLAWYCERIYHPNTTGEIILEYESHGCFEFFEVYRHYFSEIEAIFFPGQNKSPLDIACKDIFLNKIIGKEFGVVFSELDLQYQDVYDQIDASEGFKFPLENDPLYKDRNNVEDPLYSDVTVYQANMQNWKRYLHLQSSELTKGDCCQEYFHSPVNPYRGTSEANFGNDRYFYVREDAWDPNFGAPFKHGYLESENIDLTNLPPGDIYKVEGLLDNQGAYDCLFDINLATGDPAFVGKGIQSFSSNSYPFEKMDAGCYDKTVGESVFSTYQQALKWFSPSGLDNEFENYFVMPNMENDRPLYLQIGPANTDQMMEKIPRDVYAGQSFPNCDLMYPIYPDDPMDENPFSNSQNTPRITSGGAIPQNFGTGAPWLMLRDFYSQVPFYACNGDGETGWWNLENGVGNCTPCDPNQSCGWQYAPWVNEPTRARKTTTSCENGDIFLNNVRIRRFAKRPYMLKTATLRERNQLGNLVEVKELKLNYRLDKVNRVVNERVEDFCWNPIQNPNDKKIKDFSGVTTDERNILLLGSIEQLPVDGSGGSIAENPTSHFDYELSDLGGYGWQPHCEGTVAPQNFILSAINDPIGKLTKIEYFPVPEIIDNPLVSPPSNQGGYSYVISSFQYQARPVRRNITGNGGSFEHTVCLDCLQPGQWAGAICTYESNYCLKPSVCGDIKYGQEKMGLPYSYQVYMVVKGKTVQDRSNQIKEWEYDYLGGTLYFEQTKFQDNFQWDKTFTPKYGISKVVVSGPFPGDEGVGDPGGGSDNKPVVTYTHSVDPLTWGKLLEVESKDANGQLLNKITNQYEAVLAYESPLYKLNNGATDYSEYESTSRPVINGNQVTSDYINAITTWLGGIQFSNHPDFFIEENTYDIPYYYDTRYHDHLSSQGWHKDYYLHSYFIKKTSESEESFDVNGASMSTQTDYVYFDAKYNGTLSSSGSTTAYNNLGFTGNRLSWEPSWQLAATYTSSPDYGPISFQELFYYWDLANVPGQNSFAVLDEIRDNGMRTIPFETRTTTYAAGESPITRSVYSIFSDEWNNNVYLSETVTQVSDVPQGGTQQVLAFTGGVPQYPYDVLVVNSIESRNSFGQVLEELDEKELRTRYTYDPNSALVTSVTIGEGETFALTTDYTYTYGNQIKTATDPNNTELSYDYDGYNRMTETRRNGVLILEVDYSHWNNEVYVCNPWPSCNGGAAPPTPLGSWPYSSFEDRATQNYVKTTHYVTGAKKWAETSYVDPIGRALASLKDNVVLEDNIYDIWDRTILGIKPHTGSEPTINSSFPNAANAEFEYEMAPRGRITRSSKYTLSYTGDHAMYFNNAIVDANSVKTELGDVGRPTSAQDLIQGDKFWRVETIDEDDKMVIEFSNILGQKVAAITNRKENEAVDADKNVGTILRYDAHGNVKMISNAKEQLSTYTHNFLGQLFRQNTVDGGQTLFGYNHSGQMIAQQDGNNVNRVYNYDNFGRLIQQATTSSISAYLENEGAGWVEYDWTFADLLGQLQASVEAGTLEKEWFFNIFDNTQPIHGEVLGYLLTGQTGVLGRLAHGISYDLLGNPIEFKFYSHNVDGFVSWEITQFNAIGLVGDGDFAVMISYPKYNRQGSFITQNVDIIGEGRPIDYQQHYVYDSWNRIKEVYANFKDLEAQGAKAAEYTYDDVKGVVAEKTLFNSGPIVDENGELTGQSCKNIKVDEVLYAYDERFRLTNINSTLFDWTMAYDGTVINNSSQNWNGNINGTIAAYNFPEDKVLNPPDNFFGGTIYGYHYDNLNRLTRADAIVTVYNPAHPLAPTLVGNPDVMGDGHYVYDKIGNFEALSRGNSFYSEDGETMFIDMTHYGYSYGGGNNKLMSVAVSGLVDPACPLTGYTYSYDGNGNLTSDAKKGLNGVTYGRANLPYGLSITNPCDEGGNAVSYLYDINDSRIFKSHSGATEFYLRDATGQELFVYDLTTGAFSYSNFTWYVYGNDRIAKIGSDVPQPEDEDCVPAPECSEGMNIEQEVYFDNLNYITDPNQLIFPTKLFRIKLCDGTEQLLLPEEMANMPGIFVLMQQTDVPNINTEFVIENSSGISVIGLAEILQMRTGALNFYVNGYDPCDTSTWPCPDEFYACNPAISSAQATVVANLQAQGSPNVNDIPIPNTVFRIRLCDATEMYVLLTQWVQIPGAPTILQQIDVNDVAQTFDLTQNGVGPITVGLDVLVNYLLDTENDIVINDYEPCFNDPPVDEPCDPSPPDCTYDESVAQQNGFEELEKVIANAEVGDYSLPTKLFRIRLCSGEEWYVLEEELYLVPGNFVFLQEISINNASDPLTLTLSDGSLITGNFEDFLNYRADGNLEIVGDYEPCEAVDPCFLEEPDCTPEEISAQQQVIADYEAGFATFDPQLMVLSTFLYMVVFCEGTALYLLKEEMDGVNIGNHYISQAIALENLDQEFTVIVDGTLQVLTVQQILLLRASDQEILINGGGCIIKETDTEFVGEFSIQQENWTYAPIPNSPKMTVTYDKVITKNGAPFLIEQETQEVVVNRKNYYTTSRSPTDPCKLFAGGYIHAFKLATDNPSGTLDVDLSPNTVYISHPGIENWVNAQDLYFDPNDPMKFQSAVKVALYYIIDQWGLSVTGGTGGVIYDFEVELFPAPPGHGIRIEFLVYHEPAGPYVNIDPENASFDFYPMNGSFSCVATVEKKNTISSWLATFNPCNEIGIRYADHVVDLNQTEWKTLTPSTPGPFPFSLPADPPVSTVCEAPEEDFTVTCGPPLAVYEDCEYTVCDEDLPLPELPDDCCEPNPPGDGGEGGDTNGGGGGYTDGDPGILQMILPNEMVFKRAELTSYPNNLNEVRLSNGQTLFALDEELETIPDPCGEVIGTIPLPDDDTPLNLTLRVGNQIVNMGNTSLNTIFQLRADNRIMQLGVAATVGPDPTGDPFPTFTFFIKDHLGNSRVLYQNQFEACDEYSVLYVLEHVVDYYPYGKTLREYVYARERFQTTDHERDEETGLDYRGARFYDSDLGRFLSLDPMAVEFPGWSDYNYVLGNPVFLIDPDGKAPLCPECGTIPIPSNAKLNILFPILDFTAMVNGKINSLDGKDQRGLSSLKTPLDNAIQASFDEGFSTYKGTLEDSFFGINDKITVEISHSIIESSLIKIGESQGDLTFSSNFDSGTDESGGNEKGGEDSGFFAKLFDNTKQTVSFSMGSITNLKDQTFFKYKGKIETFVTVRMQRIGPRDAISSTPDHRTFKLESDAEIITTYNLLNEVQNK